MPGPPAVKPGARAPPATPAARRGRPRSTAARDRVLAAARALVDRHGPSGVTIEAVAAQSGVGKPTIYRTWPNAQAVVMAALMVGSETAPAVRAHGSAVAALRRQLRDVVATFQSRTGRNVTMMLASAEPETELSKAFRHHFILARRDEGRRLLAAAVDRRELRRTLDVETALDALYGPLFFRILVGHAPVSASFCDALIDELLTGWAPPVHARRATARAPRP